MTIERKIDEILPDGRFGATLDNEHRIIACTAAKMRRYRIRSVVRDHVHVEMTPYDLTKGSDRLSRTDTRPRARRHPTAGDKALTRFHKGGSNTAAHKEKMNSIDTGASRRHAISLHKSAAGNESRARHMAFPAMLSTIELRRLVATMVD